MGSFSLQKLLGHHSYRTGLVPPNQAELQFNLPPITMHSHTYRTGERPCRSGSANVGTLKAKRMAKAMSMTAVLSESSTRPLLRPLPGLMEGPLVPPGP